VYKFLYSYEEHLILALKNKVKLSEINRIRILVCNEIWFWFWISDPIPVWFLVARTGTEGWLLVKLRVTPLGSSETCVSVLIPVLAPYINRTENPIPRPIIKRRFQFWKSDQIPVRFFLRGTGDSYRAMLVSTFYQTDNTVTRTSRKRWNLQTKPRRKGGHKGQETPKWTKQGALSERRQH
jgi:hypothetical protein